MSDHRRVSLEFIEYEPDEMVRRSAEFYRGMRRRHSVRDFDTRTVPLGVIENAILAAGTSPSGANQQPWHFVVVTDPRTKQRIREKAEEIERGFYEERAPQAWVDAVAPLGVDASKPFLEDAPVLIAVFLKKRVVQDGELKKTYYPIESVGIAAGILITALHTSGLGTLTYTPAPMGFLREMLGRPDTERPVMVVAVGYPAPGATVPEAPKAPLGEIATIPEPPAG